MTSKLTRDIIQSEIADFFAGVVEIHTELGGPNTVEEAQNQLTERVLACVPAEDSEPVATLDVQSRRPDGNKFALVFSSAAHKLPDDVYFLYRHAQPAPETEREPIAWLNDAYLARGVVDGEAGSEDAGPGYIPVYREASPAQPAPVVPDAVDEGIDADDHPLLWSHNKGWNACRAAMLQAGNSPAHSGARPEQSNGSPAQDGNSPVIPDGYVMVPMRLTAENGAKGALACEFSETKFVNCPECFGDDECETCDGSGRIEMTVPVTWTTIKEIWAKGVEHFAAAPQEVPDEQR